MPKKQPDRLVVRSYNVGFGDCFLLSFGYGANDERHLLIDFGTTALPENAGSKVMKNVAADIQDVINESHGRLVAVVASHRHRDHISGFAGTTGQTIEGLNPEVVIQPWTENPDAAIDATEAATTSTRNLTALHTLANMQSVASHARAVAKRFKSHNPALSERLEFIGEENVLNLEAIRRLMNMGSKPARYLNEGDSFGIGKALPGVKVHVLGPPDLTQTERIRQQTHTHEDEFWQMKAQAAGAGQDLDVELFPKAEKAGHPVYARWFRRKMKDLHMEEMLQLVLELDEVLNNTSLILLFETRGHYFLFPGDAQWENWEHALSKDKYKKLLKKVHLYKVGHHGSRNATPKTELWQRFRERSKDKNADRLTTLLSTKNDKHGHAEDQTEVPRTTLVDALDEESDLADTRKLESDEICYEYTYTF